MTKIILASSSPQRRNLIGHLRIPFKVMPSKAQEITKISTNVIDLVKHNALIKAQEVASRIKSGIVIGCDTIVYSHKQRLILKPKDLKEAKKNLNELMEMPHWVYSGLALINVNTGEILIDYDKTKVFMNQLSSKQIDRYHRLVSPLDKAGGFDIEDRGALFIPRIEGCYFNVVGLPLAKLTVMLEKFNVKVL